MSLSTDTEGARLICDADLLLRFCIFSKKGVSTMVQSSPTRRLYRWTMTMREMRGRSSFRHEKANAVDDLMHLFHTVPSRGTEALCHFGDAISVRRPSSVGSDPTLLLVRNPKFFCTLKLRGLF